jgi:hypothetical protein
VVSVVFLTTAGFNEWYVTLWGYQYLGEIYMLYKMHTIMVHAIGKVVQNLFPVPQPSRCRWLAIIGCCSRKSCSTRRHVMRISWRPKSWLPNSVAFWDNRVSAVSTQRLVVFDQILDCYSYRNILFLASNSPCTQELHLMARNPSLSKSARGGWAKWQKSAK